MVRCATRRHRLCRTHHGSDLGGGDVNLNNLAPLLISAVLFIGLTAWLTWPSKPPTRKPTTHDPSTCEECRWNR